MSHGVQSLACGVELDSFTQSDLDQLQQKLNELT